MILKTLNHHPHVLIQPPKFNRKIVARSSSLRVGVNSIQSVIRLYNRRNGIVTGCVSSGKEIVSEEESVGNLISEKEEFGTVQAVESNEALTKQEFSTNESIWAQMVEIVKFSGPAVGLWLCGPLMSLIDTVVVGQESSIELAALGPGTVFCDHTSYVFMFLSIATSNLVATALARGDKKEVQYQISVLLFIGLAGGLLMLLFTKLFGPMGLTAFAGAKNKEIISAANTYVQIRALAWPAILVGMVAQSASLGMKDSWGPLKALAVASAINGVGDVVLCRYFGYGIAGAAWATMVSQVVAAIMMIEALNKRGYDGYAISIPSSDELMHILAFSAPVFLTIMSKVLFYTLLVYLATSMGTHIVAAHQVLIQLFCMCAVFAEPLSQTAQSFMPELFYGVNRSLPKARMLLKSLVIIGALSGLILGSIGTSVPWFFPKIFSPDVEVIQEMHKALVPYFMTLCITPSSSSVEGTLLAGRDLKFVSFLTTAVFCLGSLLAMLLSSRGWGLIGCWLTLAAFQWSRFLIALRRLTLPTGLLYSEDMTRSQPTKLRTA